MHLKTSVTSSLWPLELFCTFLGANSTLPMLCSPLTSSMTYCMIALQRAPGALYCYVRITQSHRFRATLPSTIRSLDSKANEAVTAAIMSRHKVRGRSVQMLFGPLNQREQCLSDKFTLFGMSTDWTRGHLLSGKYGAWINIAKEETATETAFSRNRVNKARI